MFQKLDEIFETEIQKKHGREQTIPRKPGPVSERPQPLIAPKFSLKWAICKKKGQLASVKIWNNEALSTEK